jgi:hypothetical protein
VNLRALLLGSWDDINILNFCLREAVKTKERTRYGYDVANMINTKTPAQKNNAGYPGATNQKKITFLASSCPTPCKLFHCASLPRKDSFRRDRPDFLLGLQIRILLRIIANPLHAILVLLFRYYSEYFVHLEFSRFTAPTDAAPVVEDDVLVVFLKIDFFRPATRPGVGWAELEFYPERDVACFLVLDMRFYLDVVGADENQIVVVFRDFGL